MKKLIASFLMAATMCSAQTGKVTFSGKIEKPNSDKVTLVHKDFKQVIPVAKDGSFSATFEAPGAIYQFFDGKEYTDVFLKPGFDLNMTTDSGMFDEHLKYTGTGAAENNLLAKKSLDEEALQEKMMALREKPEEMNELLRSYSQELATKLTADGIDPDLKKAFDQQAAEQVEQQKQMRAEMEQAKADAKKMVGTASPGFNYENHKGGKTKLSDFKGKYVYIDNWATWCGPCRMEIPFLQKIEEQYKGKNIAFVSISVDVKKDHDKWKKFVTEKDLGGTQLIADKDWRSDFIRAYHINSIPRFILIGPDGNIVDADAKRPSDPELQKQLDELLK